MKFIISFWAEATKGYHSKVLLISVIVSAMLPLIGGLFMVILKDPELARRLGIIGVKAQLAGSADWPSYFGLLSQAIALGGFFIFGFIAVWIFGREYSDHTMKDLLALPTPRWAIVSAKLTVIMLWCLLLSLFILGIGFVTGWAIGLPLWSSEVVNASAARFLVASCLTILVILPVCFVANAGRGYLLSLGFLVVLIVLAEVLAALGWGEFFPWSIPPLYSGTSGAVQLSSVSYIIVISTGILGAGATLLWWYTSDHVS
jgi:ABC-2 type transport system permease protein